MNHRRPLRESAGEPGKKKKLEILHAELPTADVHGAKSKIVIRIFKSFQIFFGPCTHHITASNVTQQNKLPPLQSHLDFIPNFFSLYISVTAHKITIKHRPD